MIKVSVVSTTRGAEAADTSAEKCAVAEVVAAMAFSALQVCVGSQSLVKPARCVTYHALPACCAPTQCLNCCRAHPARSEFMPAAAAQLAEGWTLSLVVLCQSTPAWLAQAVMKLAPYPCCRPTTARRRAVCVGGNIR